MCDEEVIQHLIELFGGSLHFEIIKSVAQTCRYNLEQSTEMLLEITSNVQQQNSKVGKRKNGLVTPVAPAASPPRKSKKLMEVDRVIDIIKSGYKIMIILRGLPGSGKSSLARQILELSVGPQNPTDFIFSADDFFVSNGFYVYNPARIGEAHAMAQQRAYAALKMGVSPVIIDNTNVQIWEMKPYAVMAMQYGYLLEILEPPTPWAFNDKELAQRNSHGVPRSKIKDMLLRYDRNVTVSKLTSAFLLRYQHLQPPLHRNYPPIVQNVQRKTRLSPSLNGFSTGKLIPHVNSFRNHDHERPVETIGQTKTAGVSEATGNEEGDASAVSRYRERMTMDELLNFPTDADGAKALKPDVVSWASPYVEKFVYVSDEENSMAKEKPKTNEIEFTATQNPPKTAQQTEKPVDWDLHAWGITETAIKCWDICTPIPDAPKITETPDVPPTPKPQTADTATLTTIEDFTNVDCLQTSNELFKVVQTCCREINEGLPDSVYTPRKRIMCDKSSSTNENVFIPDRKQHMELLTTVFPNVPVSYLREIYEKCRGDINWTVDLLSEDNKYALESVEGGEIGDECADEGVEVADEALVSVIECEPEVVRKTKPKQPSAESVELKKAVEKLIDIDKNFYSDHLLRIKNSRHPIVEEPSTSAQRIESVDLPSPDFDECDSRSDSSEEMLELNLGETLVNELEHKLHEPNFSYPKGFQPVVQLPVGMARQLYALYIESVYQQMDAQKEVLETMVKEDEAFAKKLQEQEQQNTRVCAVPEPKNLSEIMDEQYATNLYQKEVDKWQQLTPDDLAAKLTKQKLFCTFPGIEQALLVEIWQAHGNNYQDTVESILASNPSVVKGTQETITQPPITQTVVDEMKVAQESNQQLHKQLAESKSASSYREEASKYLEKRTELYQKAQQYYQRGMTEVAQFYSELAKDQTLLFDRANNLAASAFLNEHQRRIQNYDTLDLHYLYVKEAISALDMFIDNSIHLLRGKGKMNNLLVITGRGNNSQGGRSRIKPAVKGRLKKRKIKYREVNPGLLEIWVGETTLITSDLQ